MSASLKLTPLAEEHIAAGARMVNFGGWDMPLAYGSQLEEHHAVRQDAGMFDVSHMLNVDISGVDAKAFLQRRGLEPRDGLSEAGRLGLLTLVPCPEFRQKPPAGRWFFLPHSRSLCAPKPGKN